MNRHVLAIALPATLANVTTPLLGLVGSVVIGRQGDAALLGAVALGAVVFDVLFWSFGALRMATAGLTAQAVGAGDSVEIDTTLARAVLAGIAAGGAMILMQAPIAALVVGMAGASSEVEAGLLAYFHIRVFAAPFTLANYAVLGSVTGRGRTDLGLGLQVGINLLNIALTLAFVLGLGWGVAGTALSAVIAEAFGTGLGLIILHRLGTRLLRVRSAALLDAAALSRTWRVNVDILLRTLALVAAISLFTFVGARSGDVVLAANAVLWNLFLVGGFFLDGFATAAEALCGQAVGARDADRFTATARACLLWCLGFGAIVTAAFATVGGPFVDWISTNATVRAAARGDLPLAALAPLLAALPFAFDGIYIGAAWTRAMRDLMLAAVAVYIVTLLGSNYVWPGNRGLWCAFLVFLGARGVGQAIAFPALTRRTFGARAAAPRPMPPA